jgi:hypothetical protein
MLWWGKKTGKKRITLEMPDALWTRLNALQYDARLENPVQVIRRALAVYELCLRTAEQGAILKAHYPDGTEQEIAI